MKDQDIENLTVSVFETFNDLKYPGDGNIVYQNAEHLECELVQEFLVGKTWKELSWDQISDCYDGDAFSIHNFLSEEGLRYYFPAFLLICITSYMEADLFSENIIELLISGQNNPGLKWKLVRSNQDKCRVVAKFLEFIKKYHSEDYILNELEEAFEFWKSAAS